MAWATPTVGVSLRCLLMSTQLGEAWLQPASRNASSHLSPLHCCPTNPALKKPAVLSSNCCGLNKDLKCSRKAGILFGTPQPVRTGEMHVHCTGQESPSVTATQKAKASALHQQYFCQNLSKGTLLEPRTAVRKGCFLLHLLVFLMHCPKSRKGTYFHSI